MLALVAWALCLPGMAGAAPGELDTGFGGDGIVKHDVDPAAPNTEGRVEIDAAGRYLVLATNEAGTSRVLRFQRDGRLDAGFGASGSVATPAGTWHDLVLQPDGGIVLAGTSGNDLAVARLTPAGQLDPAFGDGGVTTAHVEPEGPIGSDKTVEQSFERVRLAPDGRIVAIGDVGVCWQGDEPGCFPQGSAVARFTPGGDLDPSFGDGGIFLFRPGVSRPWIGVGNLNALAIQPDGRILAGGTFAEQMIVIRLTAAGALDRSFSGDGRVRSKLDTVGEEETVREGNVRAIVLQRSGRIVAVGGELLLALKPNGALDRSFGRRNLDGVAPIPNAETTYLTFDPSEAVVDGKGRILLAGQSPYETVVSRFYPNGEHDPRFAGDGLAQANLAKTYTNSEPPEEGATDLALEPDGAPITAGFAFDRRHSRLALTRWTGGDGRRARCHGRPATLQGTPGDDRLTATGVIVAFGGADKIRNRWGLVCAGAGDDEVAGNGFAAVYSGPGDDKVIGQGSSPVYGGAGDDVLVAHEGYDNADVYFGGPGNDLLAGGRGPDRLYGGPGRDRLSGGRGYDRLFGGPGADRESGEGGGGRKAFYTARGRDGFRIKLVVRKNRVTGVHLRARVHCSDGGSYRLTRNTNSLNARIHPNGRFRNTTTLDTSEGWNESLLSGRVTREKIVGIYWDRERTATETCKAKSRFVARRGGG